MLLGKNIHVRHPDFQELYRKLQDKMNENNIQVFHPKTIDDLKEELIYLQGGILND